MVKPKDTQKKPFASHLHRLSFMNMRDLIRNDAQTGTDNIFIKEDIAVARSIRPLIGKFNSREPFFMVDARMGIIRKGHGHYTVNLMETDFREGDVVYMSRGSIVQVGEMSDDFDFTGVAFDEDHLNLAFNGQPPLLFQQYAYHRILHASAAEFDTFNRYMDTLWAITQLPYDTRRLAGKSVGPLLSLFELCIAR